MLPGRPVHINQDMADLPGAPALPLPAPTPALLATLFVDAERDPTHGNWRETIQAFTVDTRNVAQKVTMIDLRQMTTTPTTTSDKPTGYVVVSYGV